MQSLGQFEELRLAYEEAFERLCAEVRILKFQEADAHPEVVKELRRRVEEAEDAYRHTRDVLAQFLIGQQSKASELAEVAC